MPDPFKARIWKVGLTVLAGLVLFYLGIVWAQRSTLFEDEENEYTVLFDNVNGLLVGDPVTVRGFVSGRVLDIMPEVEAVIVRISMDKRIELRTDARAEIQLKELMGGKQVAIHPGLSPDKLQPGSALPGVASLDFSSSFSEFGAVIEQVNLNQLNQLLARLDTFAASLNTLSSAVHAEELESMFQRINRMSLRLESGMEEIETNGWIDKMDQLFNRAERTLTQADTALNKVIGLGNTFGEADLRRAQSLLSQAEQSLTRVDAVMLDVDQLLDTLMTNQTLAGQLITDAAFRQRIDSTVYRLDRTQEQVYQKRIIVGLRRKKSENP